MSIKSEFGPQGRKLLDLLLPPLCHACGSKVSEIHALCASCWANVSFIEGSVCDICGEPFEFLDHSEQETMACANCLKAPPAYDAARAAFVYNDGSRALVTGFKFNDRLDRLPIFGHWLERAGTEMITMCDAILPVPLHRWRLIARRYNQAALLAREISKRSSRPVLFHVLQRVKSTRQQVGLSAKGRKRNVANAFRVSEEDRSLIENKRLLLVDDVVTSGATVEACAKVLKRAGAAC